MIEAALLINIGYQSTYFRNSTWNIFQEKFSLVYFYVILSQLIARQKSWSEEREAIATVPNLALYLGLMIVPIVGVLERSAVFRLN